MNTRNLQVALRRLRKFARQGTELEFDLKETILTTSKKDLSIKSKISLDKLKYKIDEE